MDNETLEVLNKEVGEFLGVKIPPHDIIVTNNIYQAVYDDDKDYAEERKQSLDEITGLFYTNANNEPIIFLKQRESPRLLETLVHEETHLIDYTKFSKDLSNNNIRELIEKAPFRIWSEFHATYYEMLYILRTHSNLDKDYFVHTKEDEIRKMCNEKSIQLSALIDKSVRIYGACMAYADKFSNLEWEFPKHIVRDKWFAFIYIFLEKHKTYKEFIKDYGEWENMLKEIEKREHRKKKF